MSVLVGLDIGTSTIKAAAFATTGALLASARRDTPWSHNLHGTELDPVALVRACLAVLNEVVALQTERVASVGVASMGETGILLDRRHQPLTPILAWHDKRDHDDVAALHELGHQQFVQTTGKPIRGQWSLTKHRWLARNGLTAGAVVRLNVAEYVVHTLGGRPASELSLASRTGWLDLAARTWWPDALTFSGISPDLLPPLVPAGEPLGRVSSQASSSLTGAVLTVAGHDHQAVAVGLGALGRDIEVDSCGTAEALLRTVPAGVEPHTVAQLAENGVTTDWSIQDGYWSLLAATEGGLAMRRTLALLGVNFTDTIGIDAAAAAASATSLQVEGLTEEALRLTNITDTVTPGGVWRAVTDAVNDQAHTLHQHMSAVAGQPTAIYAAGGWVNSSAFMAAKTARFGPITRADAADAGARGAAIVGGHAAGELPGLEFVSTQGGRA